MSRTPFFQKMFSRRQRLLVVETDGFGLRAAVLVAERKTISFEKVAATHESDPDVALSEVISAFRADSGVLPVDAILLTATAVPALLGLPVPPTRPRPPKQMQEMVRWEMESFFVQRVGVWKLGAVFVRRGYLRPDQVEMAIQTITPRSSQNVVGALDNTSPQRLGDGAVARGWVTPEQLEECLAIQRRLRAADDEIVCGWSPQSVELPPDGSANAARKSSWLVCGMGKRDRLQWDARFKQQGLVLQGIYPLVGCAAAALNGAVSSSGMVTETRGGMMGCVRLQKGRLLSLQVLYTDTPAQERPRSVAGEEALYLAEEEADPSRPRPKQEAQPIAVSIESSRLPEGVHASMLAGMLGAARHRWGMTGGERAPSLPARDPGPPLWRQPQVWWTGVGLATLLVIAGTEGGMALRRQALRRHHADLLQTIAEREKTDRAILELQNEMTQLRTQLDERQGTLQSLLKRKEMLVRSGSGRAERMGSLLDRVTMALPDAVTLMRVSDTQAGVQIEARAFSETALAQFALHLAEAVAPLAMKVGQFENKMQAVQSRPDEEADYRMTLQLIPVPPAPPQPQAAPPSDPSLMDKVMQGLSGLIGRDRNGMGAK